ncbi:MAG TPA: lipid II flippase MurJ [Actinomycetota bacterium]|nr:lipid II flippase MurJ [Actinomycetota bacterium]
MRPAPGTARAAAGMGAIVAVSRAAGFVRVLVVAAVLGTSYLGNAFQAANSFSNVLFELLAAGALSAVLVPTFVRLLDAGDRRGAEEVAGGVLGVAVLLLGGGAVAGVLAAPLLARLLTLGVPETVAAEQRELVTFLLRFFIPQVVLYGAGTVAIAVLQARRRFPVTVAAPIGNTVVMVACLLLFGASTSGPPGFDLTGGQRWLLVLAGSGGVVAFVGILLAACWGSGFRLLPKFRLSDPRVAEILRHSGWGVVLHSAAGLLLGAAIVAGSAVEGAVVAYQVGWVFFLAPYAMLAQPIQTAVLPELVAESGEAGLERFRTSVRWALERTALFALPATAAMMAVALPAMRAVSFGNAGPEDAGLLAAAVAALAVGLLPYGAFLLLARSYYALGDSRTPGLVALAVAAAGVAVMVAGSLATEGPARVAVLGAGHSVAYLLGSLYLVRDLGRRTGGSVAPARFGAMAALSAAVGTTIWLAAQQAVQMPGGRLRDLGIVAGAGLIGGGVVLLGYRLMRMPASLTQRVPAPVRPAGSGGVA